jgi:hypothetical protein
MVTKPTTTTAPESVGDTKERGMSLNLVQERNGLARKSDCLVLGLTFDREASAARVALKPRGSLGSPNSFRSSKL